MKRKVYVKQMKMQKEKAKSQAKDKRKKPETKASSLSDNVSDSQQCQETSQVPPDGVARSHLTPPVESPMTSWSTVTTSTHTNSGPLPTVDVLMKSRSTLRAFQLRQQHQESPRFEDERNVSSNEINALQPQTFKQDLPPPPPSSSSLSSASSYVANQEDLNNHHVERWVKDCSSVEQIPTIVPKLIHPAYAIDCPDAYNVNLDQTEHHTNDNRNSQPSPPPVFHQLQQVTRLNDKTMSGETPSNNMTGYFAEQEQHNNSMGQHHQYTVMDTTGSDVTPHHHLPPHQLNHHDMSTYDHNPTHHHANNNNHDENFHEHHGQVRAWEQENYRYVDFTWRHADHGDDEPESSYTDSKSSDDESYHSKHNDSTLDESVDLSNKSSTRRSTKSGSGRRRRKRVQTPVQRSAANMRERRRMCHLNVAFDYLKEHLPNVKDKKKLSRIQTLKAAIYYIHLLQDSLSVH